MKKRLALIILMVLTLYSAIPVYVYAADPPESVSVTDVKGYRNLVETGDILYVFQYDIAFASDNYSSDPASDTYLFRLYAADNTTLLATSIPYVYPFFESNGYGDGVSAFYFSVTDTKPTWEDLVTINLYGSSVYFTPAPDPGNSTVSADKYTSSTTQDDNQAELKAYVLLLCDRLEAAYQGTGIILKASSDSGIVLSPYGELYFRGAITGLQSLCPGLFFIQVYIPEVMPVESYNMTMGDVYGGRLDTDDIGRSFDRIGEFVGGSGIAAAMVILIAISIGLCIWTVRKGWGVEPGFAGSGLIGIFFAIIMGDAIFTVLMIGSLGAVMGIVWLVLLKRA